MPPFFAAGTKGGQRVYRSGSKMGVHGPQGFREGISGVCETLLRCTSGYLPPHSFLLFAKPSCKCEKVPSLHDLYVYFSA